MLGAVAQFERDLILERTRAGLAVARKNGKRLGPPVKWDPTMAPRARALMDKGELSAEEVAGPFKISRRTLFRGLKAARDHDRSPASTENGIPVVSDAGVDRAAMSSFPEKLADRFRRFHHRHFLPKAEEYEELAAYGQSPEAMVISCSDSRVDPETIFSAIPGELFVVT